MTRRALVLGAGGFLGSHVTRRLVADGWHVRGVVRDPGAAHIVGRLGSALNDVDLVAGDAGDPRLLSKLVVGHDAVFPFAGHSGATRSLAEPFADLIANAGGQLALLEALRCGNRDARVVFPGSRLQYGKPRSLPVSEDHPQEPISLYGMHKMVGEHYHRLYHDLYGIMSCCLRISIPYGPRQDRPDRAFGVVGNFLATAAGNGEIQVYGDGRQLRDYVFIDDLVDLCVRAATHPAAVGGVFNVGGPRPVSIQAMAEAVVATVGHGRIVNVPWPALEAAVETGDYVGDLSRAEADLEWTPTVTLERGLAATWAELAPTLTAAG